MGRSPHFADSPVECCFSPKFHQKRNVHFPSSFGRSTGGAVPCDSRSVVCSPPWQRWRSVSQRCRPRRPWPAWTPASPRCRSTARTRPRPSRARRRRPTGRRAPPSSPPTTRLARRHDPRLRGGRRDRRAAPHDPDRRLHQRPARGRRRHPGRHVPLRLVRRRRVRSDDRLAYVFSRNCCTATGLDPSVFRLEARPRRCLPGRVVPVAPRGDRPEGRGLPTRARASTSARAPRSTRTTTTRTPSARRSRSRAGRRRAGHDLLGRRRAPLRDVVRRRGLARPERREALSDQHVHLDDRARLDLRPHSVRGARPTRRSTSPPTRSTSPTAAPAPRATRCVVRSSSSTCPTSRCSRRRLQRHADLRFVPAAGAVHRRERRRAHELDLGLRRRLHVDLAEPRPHLLRRRHLQREPDGLEHRRAPTRRR